VKNVTMNAQGTDTRAGSGARPVSRPAARDIGHAAVGDAIDFLHPPLTYGSQ
jgi:hypothetical protein